jgi:hypothetical protein
VDAVLQYRARQILEMEDLVAAFVENELGRHDWANNWAAWKTKYPNFLERIKGFFHHLGEDVDPQEIATYIDRMIIARPGRWR